MRGISVVPIFFCSNYCYYDEVWMNKEKFTRAGFEPATSGLTCPILAVSLFCQYLCSGVPDRSHETICCPSARDDAKVMIQPGKRQ